MIDVLGYIVAFVVIVGLVILHICVICDYFSR